MFVVRQMGNKINTNFLSVSVVCIVLLLTIGIFSGGYSMQNILSTELKGDVPYDFSLYAYGYGYEEEPKPIFENLSNDIKNYDGIVAWDEYDIKESGYTFGDLQQESDYEYMKTALVTLLSLSEYNVKGFFHDKNHRRTLFMFIQRNFMNEPLLVLQSIVLWD